MGLINTLKSVLTSKKEQEPSPLPLPPLTQAEKDAAAKAGWEEGRRIGKAKEKRILAAQREEYKRREQQASEEQPLHHQIRHIQENRPLLQHSHVFQTSSMFQQPNITGMSPILQSSIFAPRKRKRKI